MNFIILGDKFQKRMKSKGCVGLIKINGKNILQHQHHTIRSYFPKAKIIYVCGFESKKILSFISKNPILKNDIVTIANKDYDKYNNAHSLYSASNFLNDDTLILFGDNVLHKKIFTGFDPNRGSQVFINNKQKSKIGCIIRDNSVRNIAYDLDNCLSEIYFLSSYHSIMVNKILTNNNLNHNCFIFEIINKLIDNNQTMIPFFADYKSPTLNKV